MQFTQKVIHEDHDVILPVDISPDPQPKRKTSNRGRKAASAAVITSSPYKNELEEFVKKKQVAPLNSRLNEEQNPTSSTSRGKVGSANTLYNKSSKNKGMLKKNEESDLSEESGNSAYSDSSSGLEAYFGRKPSTEDDAICLFCEGKFSDDKRGELWVQCIMCQMWAHNDCADCEKDIYVCDFCR